MRIAIVENTAVTHHGQVGVALHEAGARITRHRPWLDGQLPADGSFDALVVFGGEQSALSDDTHPYLPHLAALMAAEAARGTAVLGICLGAQLMARGLGAQNRLNAALEFGWHEVTLTDAGLQDPVMSALPVRFPIFEWHTDTFAAPPGAQHMATSPRAAQQAYRYGRAGYGMQFHFEACRSVVADWTRTFPDLVETLEPGWTDALPRRSADVGAQSDAHGLTIARNWVALI